MEHALDLLDKTYNGRAWYGKNIFRSLQDVPLRKTLLRLNGSYNIVELLHHMLAWRDYLSKLLSTGESVIIPDDKNFPTIDFITDKEWQRLLERVETSQNELRNVIAVCNLKLSDKVQGKPYEVNDVLYGVMQHDVYHIGQINFLAKFLE